MAAGGASLLAAERPADGTVRASRADLIRRASSRLTQAQNRIRAERAKALDTRRSQMERLRELTTERRAVERTLASARREIERLRDETKRREEKLAEIEEQTAASKERARVLLAAVGRYFDRVEDLVKAGIPWQREDRLKALTEARKTLEGETPNPAAALAAAGRVQKEEESLARLVETGKVRLDLGSETFDLSAFHLGLLAVVYSSSDREIVGFVRAGQDLADGRAAVEGNPAAADGYLRAVDILQRRRTPSLVELYFPSLPVGGRASAPAGDPEGAGEDGGADEEGAE